MDATGDHLAGVGFTGEYDLSAVHIEGIRHVMADIRLLRPGLQDPNAGIIQNTDAGVEARVHCALVPSNALLANVNGVMNAVQVISDGAGETLFSGPGAGGEAAASAVLSDALALGQQVSAGNGIDADVQTSDKTHAPNTAILAMADVTSANYLRIPTLDQPGVFAQVTKPCRNIPSALMPPFSTKQAPLSPWSTSYC